MTDQQRKAQQLKYIEGDMFSVLESNPNKIIIPHICNSHGAWGAGFVVPLGRHFPKAKESYLAWAKERTFVLGSTQIVQVSENVHVANMVAQVLGGARPLFYNHLAKCLDDVAKFVLENSGEIHAPMFGSGLAGGNWNIVEELICDSWLRYGLSATIYYLPGTLPDNWQLPH